MKFTPIKTTHFLSKQVGVFKPGFHGPSQAASACMQACAPSTGQTVLQKPSLNTPTKYKQAQCARAQGGVSTIKIYTSLHTLVLPLKATEQYVES